MKIAISKNQKIDGYTNISVSDNIDKAVEDNTAIEIITNNILDVIPPNVIVQYYQNLVHKLTSGGVLKVVFNDIRNVCESFCKGDMTIESFHDLVFGEGYSNRSICELDLVKNMLVSMGLKIEIVTFINSYSCLIEARKK